MTSKFLVSLDFEMQWGFYDLANRLSEAQLQQIPIVVPKLLQLFQAYGVRSTWGIVAAMGCSTPEQLKEALQRIPFHYMNERCHPHAVTEELAHASHHYLAPDLVKLVRSFPEVEIASHTFSHFYTRELPFSEAAWKEDLLLSRELLPEAITLLFPRNQYHERAIELAKEVGFTCFRSNPCHWLYRVPSASAGSLWKRGVRFLDHYYPVASHQFVKQEGDLVSYSRFFRPAEKLSMLRRRKLDRIKQSMTVAAMTGQDYHLYFHPHNMTTRQQQSFEDLEEVTRHFQFLQNQYGMQSVTLGEYAK